MSEQSGQIVVDGVHRYPPNGIKVVIAGGGNGGLTAALECWRKGCDVIVLERAAELSPVGDFFTLTPSALVTLKHYPRLYKAYHEKVIDCSISLYTPSGQPLAITRPEWRREGVVHACPEVDVSFLNRRPEFTAWQHEQLNALGIPIRFATKVTGVTEDDNHVAVHTEGGEVFVGDVCVAADGIGSKVPWPVPGGFPNVKDSGFAMARVAFPRSVIRSGSLAEGITKTVDSEGPQFRTYVGGEGVTLILFLTGEYVAWAFSHAADDHAAEDWHNKRDPKDILKLIEQSNNDWDPAVIDFVRQTPHAIVDWRLMWRDGIKQWTSDGGRVIKLGDSAHTFFPTAGNGAVQALEDAVSLAECLHQQASSSPANVPWATRVHNALRFHRVSVLQRTGFINREELHHADSATVAPSNPDQGDPTLGFFRIGRWVWGHDPEAYARRNYQKCLDHVRDGKKFLNTNLPPGHVYEEWDLESESRRIAEGAPSGLKENGYWGM